MAERPSWAVSDTDGIITVEDARVSSAVGYMPDGTTIGQARSGWLPTSTDPGVVTASATADVNVHVAALERIFQSTRGQGSYVQVNDASVTIDILTDNPADSTNDRHDLIVAQQNDSFYGDTADNFHLRHVVGTAASSPSDPTVDGSPDYYELARIVVRAGATTIQSSDITDLRPPEWTVPAGGVLPVADATERDDIAAPYNGYTVWRRDRSWPEAWDGSGWRVVGTPVVSSESDLSAITSPYEGQLAVALTEALVFRWDGGAWVSAWALGGSTASTRHEARYYQASSRTAQSIPSATNQRIHLPDVTYSSDDVTVAAVGGGTEFTLHRTGVWQIEGTVRYVASTSNAERYVYLADTGAGTRYGQGGSAPSGGPWSGNVSVTRRFVAGDKVSLWAWQNTGGDLSLDLLDNGIAASLTWLRG